MRVLAGVALLYVLIQQRLNDISERLSKIQTPAGKKPLRSTNDVRRELAAARDPLAVLEAKLVADSRDEMSPEEIHTFEQARNKIKASIDKLKQSGDWVGVPFDLNGRNCKRGCPGWTPFTDAPSRLNWRASKAA